METKQIFFFVKTKTKTRVVLAPKGHKDVYEVDHAPAKTSLTVMFTFCADGRLTPPMVIFPIHAPSKSAQEIIEPPLQIETHYEEPILDQLHQDQAVTVDPQVQHQPKYITLPHFKRTAGTSNNFIYPHCFNSVRLCIPIVMRIRFLIDHQLFVPKASRICSEHILLFNWEEVIRGNQFIHDFTAEHIKEMMNLSKRQSKITLNLENIDD